VKKIAQIEELGLWVVAHYVNEELLPVVYTFKTRDEARAFKRGDISFLSTINIPFKQQKRLPWKRLRK